ncbi:MFS general substrate transporter [Gigaspora margarita]|uniref:MFS general substrate transporter n=1 Tax=Gigaspora margarita TaxID=4874 RepID=A0A8H4ENS2_GIGMA|nr:MFS general substrate transporter [Gigaspora margarita]
MSKKNSTNILDSKDRVLKLESFSLETSLEIEKVPHEICVQNITKNEANDNNTIVNRNLNNIDDPMNWSSKKKWLVLAIITIAGPSMPIGGSIHFPALVAMQKEFKASSLAIDTFGNIHRSDVGNAYTFFLGVGSIVFGAYSDKLATRKKVYVASFLIFILAAIVCAIAKNIWLLVVMRSVQAFANSAILPLCAGVISDIYIPIGPSFGGFIAQYLGWRWVLAIFGGVILFLILFFLPETFNATFLNSNPNLRFNPLSPLKLLKYPNITIIIIYICISTLFMHIQNISIPVNYSSRYNFTTLEIGLFFIAPSLGYMLGSLIGGKYSDFLAQKFLSTSDNYCPEVRIKAAWFGSLLLPIAIFIYGWLLEINFNVYVLGIILFLCSFGMLSTFNTLSTYLVDSCPGLGASVMALTCLIRLAIPATIAIFETTIEERLGVRWMFTLISVICFLGILLLVVVYINGRKWRSNFVSTI